MAGVEPGYESQARIHESQRKVTELSSAYPVNSQIELVNTLLLLYISKRVIFYSAVSGWHTGLSVDVGKWSRQPR